MWINNIVNNDQSRLGINNNNLFKYKSIAERRLLKPDIRTVQKLTNQAPIKRFQKSYYNYGNLTSEQGVLNRGQICNNIINNNNIQDGTKNNGILILKDFNYNNNLQYHEITNKNNYQIYNKKNGDGGIIDLNQYNQDKNTRKYYNYYINNNKENNFFKESLRKNEEIKKNPNTFHPSKFLNEQSEIINKKKSNFPPKEERCSKATTNYVKKSKFPNDSVPKKIDLLNKNKSTENQNNNYNKEKWKKTQRVSLKSNNFRNSSIQHKNLLKYAGNYKESDLKPKDRINKPIINYQQSQSIKKFDNCKIQGNDSFFLLNKKKIFNKLKEGKKEYFSILPDEKKKILIQKLSESFLIEGKKKKEKLLKPELSQHFLIEGKEEKNKNRMTDKIKIMEILKHNNCTNEEIREILREFYVIINPNIESNSQKKNILNENIQKNSNDKILIEVPKKELNDDLKRGQKIYGFKNAGNNCFLNSSLQLLTRIKELKDEVLNFGEGFQDNETQGKLIVEFRNILNSIENSSDNNLIINPARLKRIMGNIDSKYFSSGQEDSNEFISNFLIALLSETGNKEVPLKKLNIINESDQKPYENLFKKFFKRRGDSFVIDLFYGILKIIKFCKNCGKTNSIKFSAYNMLEFQLYILAKKYPNKDLTLQELYNNYLEDKLSEGESCSFCGGDQIYLKTSVYTLPKYLMLCLQRVSDNDYFYNKVIYPSNLKMKGEYDDNINSYTLDCVIEHSGGCGFGHYTALVPIEKDNSTWWRFSDSIWNGAYNGYKSDNAFLLLYKLIKRK